MRSCLGKSRGAVEGWLAPKSDPNSAIVDHLDFPMVGSIGSGNRPVTRRRISLAALLVAVLPGVAAAQSQGDAVLPRIEWRACPWTQPQQEAARCGHLVVPQARAIPAGTQVRMFFAIYPATGDEQPLPDPIVVVPGGPGALFNPPVPYVMRGLANLRQRRDVIIVDQRGVGRSIPRLACEENGRGCLAQLKERGVDLASYNTEETARDLADLRRALRFDAWNAIGASYGSRVILRLAQIDSAGTRAAVSMASLPLAPSLARAENAAGRRALLARLFQDCAADPACASTHGDLLLKYARIQQILKDGAFPPMPQGEDLHRHLREVERRTNGFEAALIAQLDWSDRLPLLPAAIADLYDLLTGAKALSHARISAIYGIGGGSRLPPIDRTLILTTTRCPEDVLPERAKQPPDDVRGRRNSCADFAAAPVPDTPPATPPPLLILTGAYDIRTLSSWSDEIAARFPGAIVARMGDAGHDVSYRHPCANALMDAFVADPTAKLDLSCVARHARPKFDVPVTVQ
jgi:pimeloyl-ACP methyl ester carboxylesterase